MYHYTESGLQHVWLENGYKEHNTSYGKAVSISDVAGLHQAIGRTISLRPRLTGAELRFLRKEMELSQRALADLLGVTEQNISLWERHGKIPKWSSRLVKLIYIEQLDGNVAIRKMIETLLEQDESAAPDLHFRTRAGVWKEAA